MAKAKKPLPLWAPDFSLAPKGTIGAAFNADGKCWFWSVRPEIKGSEKRPWDKKWRGPVYGEGFTFGGEVKEEVRRAMWEHSWISKPK